MSEGKFSCERHKTYGSQQPEPARAVEMSTAGVAVAANDPLLADVGVIAVVPDQLTTIWGPRLHVLSRLAKYFHVVWVGPAPGWREALQSLGRTSLRERKRPLRQPSLPPGFVAYTPDVWLPEFYRPGWLGRLMSIARLRRARRVLEDRHCRKIILYLWRPEFADALAMVPADLSCYHIDDEYTFSEVDLPIQDPERRLLAAVGQVFIHSPALWDKKGHVNRHTALVPNGVDFRAYATAAPEPSDLASIPRPRIGYTGIIKKQLNWVLLRDLAQVHPDWSFVYVGPRNKSLSEPPESFRHLCRLSNVHFLGPKDVQLLSAYPQHFDVCIMPYAANDYTQYIYPLKLHEYLASGRPVVGTHLRSLEDFANVVTLVSTLDEWSAALRTSLAPAASSDELRQRRQMIARSHDWDILVGQIALTLATRLGPEYAERIRALAPLHGDSSLLGQGLQTSRSRALPGRWGLMQPRNTAP